MAESIDQSQAERDEALAQASMNNIAHYAESLLLSIPNDAQLVRKVLRENLRALISALAKCDGNQNTSEFLELWSIKYSRTVIDDPSMPTGLIEFAGQAKVVQFSERYRKKGRPS